MRGLLVYDAAFSDSVSLSSLPNISHHLNFASSANRLPNFSMEGPMILPSPTFGHRRVFFAD
jgi:hypothetical protein